MTYESVEDVTVAGEGVTASLLVWRRFRRPMPGLVELVYDLNPGLALSGTHIPVGTVVKLPIPADKPATGPQPVRLWG